jgi:hypothetical protein
MEDAYPSDIEEEGEDSDLEADSARTIPSYMFREPGDGESSDEDIPQSFACNFDGCDILATSDGPAQCRACNFRFCQLHVLHDCEGTSGADPAGGAAAAPAAASEDAEEEAASHRHASETAAEKRKRLKAEQEAKYPVRSDPTKYIAVVIVVDTEWVDSDPEQDVLSNIACLFIDGQDKAESGAPFAELIKPPFQHCRRLGTCGTWRTLRGYDAPSEDSCGRRCRRPH